MTAEELYALNRRVAEALGYTFEQQLSECQITTPDGQTWYDGGMGHFITAAFLACAIGQGMRTRRWNW